MAARNVSTKKREQGNLLDYISRNDEALEIVKIMLSARPPETLWRGVIAVPPGTLIEAIVTEFERSTNIPLEIPFFVFFHIVAGYLLQRGVSIKFENSNMDEALPDPWTVLLSSSGSGKTLTYKTIAGVSDDFKNLEWDVSGIAGAAKFVEDLASHNNTLMVRDEFNEFYKRLLDERGPMAEIRDYLLRIYSNQTVERSTKKETITVEKPAVAVLGMTVYECFVRLLSLDDMMNGFAQRFSYIIAQKDPKRPARNYPIYRINRMGWTEQWNKLKDAIKFTQYISTDEAIQGYMISFNALFRDDIPESFMRRIMWRAHKYALLYHILRGRGTMQEIEAEDYGWAARILSLQLHDALTLLTEHGASDLEKTIRSAETLITKLKRENRPVNARILVSNIRAIKSIQEARTILQLLSSDTSPRARAF